MDAYFPAKNWIRIDSATYIQADGKKYIIAGSENIVLNEYHWMPDSNEDHFTLIFPPLPAGTKTIDFIESDCDDCFKIWGINLTGKTVKYTPQLPDNIINFKVDNEATLPKPEFKIAKTKVTLYLTGWEEGYSLNNLSLSIQNIFTWERDEIEGRKEAEGKYVFETDQYMTSMAYLRAGGKYMQIYLSPGENTEVYLDLTAQSKAESRYHPQPDMIYGGFKGVFEQINTQLLRYGSELEKYSLDLYNDTTIVDKTKEEYINYITGKYKEKISELEKSGLPAALKQVLESNLKCSFIENIVWLERVYYMSYMIKNKKDWNEQVDYIPPTATESELKVLKDIGLNDPMLIYSSNFVYPVSKLLQITSVGLLNEITGSEKGLLQDLKMTQPILAKSMHMLELTVEENEILKSASSPFYLQLYNHLAEKTKNDYEEAMSKGGFVIIPTPKVKPDKILEEIIAGQKGKAVFVDFWATWCGPCLNGMKIMKPIKPEMKEKGVVSVYISNVSSPKAKWLKMLSEIGGVHYYLTDQEWRGLSDKYKIEGIPTYMIFDKGGKKTFEATGFPGNDKIKEELAKVW